MQEGTIVEDINGHGRPDSEVRAASPRLHSENATSKSRSSLKKLTVASLVAVLGFAPAFALAQAQRDETIVEREETMLIGQVQSVDETGTAITLTDGTKLLTPPGSVLRPGALEKGAMVIAMYREENGDKILTRLSLAQSESAP